MNEPRGPGLVVSWRDPEVSGFDVDWMVRRPDADPEFPWLSMGSGEQFSWGEVVDLAEKAGVELIVWRREAWIHLWSRLPRAWKTWYS